MTHDELLAKVELTLGTYISKYYGSKKDVELRSNVIDLIQALRAVVELCNFLDKKGRCCVPVQEVIDAIEKELGNG